MPMQSPSPSTIPTEVSRILELLDVLDKTVEGLNQKLSAVTKPELPVVPGSGSSPNVDPMKSDLFLRLEAASTRLNGSIGRISNITNRLEL
jgi:hypothetical protein